MTVVKLTKTDMVKNVIMLIAGAGKKKKGPLRQRAVCPCASFFFQVGGYHSVQQVCSRKSRGKKKKDVHFITGYWR